MGTQGEEMIRGSIYKSQNESLHSTIWGLNGSATRKLRKECWIPKNCWRLNFVRAHGLELETLLGEVRHQNETCSDGPHLNHGHSQSKTKVTYIYRRVERSPPGTCW